MLASSLVLFLLSFIQYITAAALPVAEPEAELVHLDTIDHGIEARQDQQCTNTAATRQCWGNGYSIATDYDSTWPTTGKVVRYTLDIQNKTLAPDGVSRPGYAINGQFPGPVIRASWGDTLSITVRNSLSTNGTSVHWHGVRQWKSNTMDGTNGITECPLAPGQSRTYTFLCTQFGTTWYHSHYSTQYSDGVVGTIIIDGPASSNYDVDLGTFPIQDWYYTPSFTLEPLIRSAILRGPPPADNILINGTNVNANGTLGKYNKVTLTKGKKYRLRLVNTATNDNYQVGLDGHQMTVITADFVPINPYNTNWLFIAVGQRYDVIINANQNIDSYWFHVVPQQGCSSNKNTNALSIFSYAGANSSTPSNSTRSNGPPSNTCVDNNSAIVPFVKLNVPTNYTIPKSSVLDVGFALVQDAGNQTLVQWNLNFTAIQAEWDKPTLEYVREHNTSYPKDMNLITLPQANTWSYWVIQAVGTIAPPQPHPIHLHGHDFYVLGAGSGTYSDSTTLNYNNPPRRDVAVLPSSGWLVIAFITDNPGAWLMHCHLAWHIGLGLGSQFLERPNDIPNPYNTPGWQSQCQTWDSYYNHAEFKETDSGL